MNASTSLIPSTLRNVLRSSVLAAAVCAASGSLLAQADTERRRGGGQDDSGRRGNMSPADMQQRMMTALRERFGVTNDEEWTVISDRITKVVELRRNSAPAAGMGGVMFGRGGDAGRGGDRGGPRGRSGGSNEVAALQAAVADKLPDAEVKQRLDRVRELRKENETKLAKAQEDLRAVLSVRQEAIAVLAGLLP